MDELREMIEIEYEKLNQIVNTLPISDKLPFISELELAGVAAYIHNFFNGLENILKRIVMSLNIQIPSGTSWHMDLLDLAVANKIISNELKIKLGGYLGFRHYFTHAYALDLYAEKMTVLIDNINETYLEFKDEIERFMKSRSF